MEIFRNRGGREIVAGILISLLVAGSHFSQEAPAPDDPAGPIVALAKTDIAAAVRKLAAIENPDPSLLDEVFDELDSRAHLQLLSEVVRDESLANRFVFGSGLLITGEAEPTEAQLREVTSFGDGMIRLRNETILNLLHDAPPDLPPILLLPSIWQQVYLTSLADGFLLYARILPGEFRPVPDELKGPGVPNEVPVVLPYLTEFPRDRAPERFLEVLDLTDALLRKKPGSVEAVARSLDELPLSVRLGFAGMAGGAPELPPDIRVTMAEWLAEAWETGVPVGWFLDESIVGRFFSHHTARNWEPVAKRLLATWPEDGEYPDDLSCFRIGIAGMLDDRKALDDLMTRLDEDLPSLNLHPLVAVLVRSGQIDLAFEQIVKRTETLLTHFSSTRVRYDSLLEERLPDLLERINDPSVRYVVELHLKILQDDDSAFPPRLARDDRLAEVARRYPATPFPSGKARYAAAYLIGKVPKAAAEIAEELVAYVNFAQADLYLSQFMKKRRWSELAGVAITAALESGDERLVRESIEKMAAATGRLNGSLHRDAHAETWDMIAEALGNHLENGESPSGELLSIARFVCGLPENYFPLNYNYLRGNLIDRTLAAHAKAGEAAAWWEWRAELDPVIRASHDESFFAHLKGVDIATVGGPDSWRDLERGKVEKRVMEGIDGYRQVIDLTERVPFDRPLAERLEAVVHHFEAVESTETKSAPGISSAIRLLHQFCYFSAEELFAHAEELAGKLDSMGAWNDLAWIAMDAGDLARAKKFTERANRPFRERRDQVEKK